MSGGLSQSSGFNASFTRMFAAKSRPEIGNDHLRQFLRQVKRSREF